MGPLINKSIDNKIISTTTNDLAQVTVDESRSSGDFVVLDIKLEFGKGRCSSFGLVPLSLMVPLSGPIRLSRDLAS